MSDRLTLALTTWPEVGDWLSCLELFVAYSVIALPVGLWRGLLRLEWVSSWTTILMTTVITFIFPSVIEEILFRVLLVPHPAQEQSMRTVLAWGIVSLILFVLAHPLNAWLVMKSRRETFWNPWFLVLATLLGGVCTITYVQSGSLWLPVGLHWGVVLIWLLCLGGDRRMSATRSPTVMS